MMHGGGSAWMIWEQQRYNSMSQVDGLVEAVRDRAGVMDHLGDGDYVFVQNESGDRSYFHLNRPEENDRTPTGFYRNAGFATLFPEREVLALIRCGLLVDVWYEEDGAVQTARSRHGDAMSWLRVNYRDRVEFP